MATRTRERTPRKQRKQRRQLVFSYRTRESAVCGALVGTLSNKKKIPTTTSSSEVADHREMATTRTTDPHPG